MKEENTREKEYMIIYGLVHLKAHSHFTPVWKKDIKEYSLQGRKAPSWISLDLFSPLFTQLL
jgi:hypothetical protein